jgi:WD40 repeat protein
MQEIDRCVERHAVFNQNGLLLAAQTYGCKIKIWKTIDGSCIARLSPNSWIYSLAFSPNAHKPYLASGGFGGIIEIWNIQKQSCLTKLQGHDTNVSSVAFNHDGSLLASGAHDGGVKIWDISKNACIAALNSQTHENQSSELCRSLLFSRDSTLLITGAGRTAPCQIAIWDLQTEQCIKKFSVQTFQQLFITQENRLLFWDNAEKDATDNPSIKVIKKVQLSPDCSPYSLPQLFIFSEAYEAIKEDTLYIVKSSNDLQEEYEKFAEEIREKLNLM